MNALTTAVCIGAATLVAGLTNIGNAADVTPDEVRAITKEAYIYAYPMVDNYRVLDEFTQHPGTPAYKGPLNKLINEARVFTAADKTIQTPNSDTPYSFFIADLRTEPYVLTVPKIDSKRYYSIQFIDAYTHNMAYVGSRATGNDAGKYLLAGPDWKGEKPEGIDKVLKSETNLVFALYRTQLFNSGDIDEVKKIQAGYKAEPLSAFLSKDAPEPAAKIEWIKPYSPAKEKTSLEMFAILNHVLQYCPTVPSEVELMERFKKIGIEAGKPFDADKLSAEVKQAMELGVEDAWKEFNNLKTTKIDTRKVTAGDLFGDRETMKNNYLYRMAGAILGIYGNDQAEAMYPAYQTDSDGKTLDATSGTYTIRFEKGKLPPVNAFWSLTMYTMPEQLLVANPLNRYLINSPMLPDLKIDEDGSLTLYLQPESPGKDKGSNWLPSPKGPFYAVMRLYWPKEEALNGTWEAPKAVRTKAE